MPLQGSGIALSCAMLGYVPRWQGLTSGVIYIKGLRVKALISEERVGEHQTTFSVSFRTGPRSFERVRHSVETGTSGHNELPVLHPGVVDGTEDGTIDPEGTALVRYKRDVQHLPGRESLD